MVYIGQAIKIIDLRNFIVHTIFCKFSAYFFFLFPVEIRGKGLLNFRIINLQIKCYDLSLIIAYIHTMPSIFSRFH